MLPFTNFSKTRIIFLHKQGKALSSTCCDRVVAEIFGEEFLRRRLSYITGRDQNNPLALEKFLGKRRVYIILITGHMDVVVIEGDNKQFSQKFREHLKSTRCDSWQISCNIAREVREQKSLAGC